MSSKKLAKAAKKFLADENGQATVEYVVLLVVVAGIILVLGKVFRDRMLALVKGPLANSLQNDFFRSDRIHQFRLNVRP